MLTIAIIFYIIMCFISNWDLTWPLTMLSNGGLGDLVNCYSLGNIPNYWAMLKISNIFNVKLDDLQKY